MPTPAPTTAAPPQSSEPLRVAIVGRIDDVASDVSAFIEQLGMEPVVLGNLPGAAAIAVEKLEELRGVDFAIMLPADGASAPPLLMATGYLLATLGRTRICFIASQSQPALPAWDNAPVVKVDDSGVWHLLLAREMKRAGVAVDLNRAL